VETVGPDLTPPPLARWQWTWRIAAAVFVSLATWGGVIGGEWSHARWLFWIDLAFGLSAFIVYRFHRRWTVAVAFLTILLGALSAAAAGPGVLAFISMSTRRRWREIVSLGPLNVVAWLVDGYVTPGNSDQWYVDTIFIIFATGISAAIGLYIGARRELLATLRDRADRAEREQAMRVAQARTNERSRIAREMHDVLAHRISLVAMHAGALSYRTDLSPREIATAADVIQQNAHQALTDLREILGVLRDAPTPDLGERPLPTLEDLQALIEDERRAGARIRLSSTVAIDAVPASIGRSAFRMVQESLTNARKHAPDTTVDVLLEGEAGGSLRIEVRNPLRVGAVPTAVPGSGLGLIGLSERADLSGGGLEHFTTARGDFVLRAWLPWPT
jgi:signal transduction histidine kinase